MRLTPTGDACPGCASTESRALFHAGDRLFQTTKKSFLVVQCGGCSLIRLYPWPDIDELKSYYPEAYWFNPGASTAAYLEEMYRRFVLRDHVNFAEGALRRAGLRGTVLDVGCGGALFGRLLGERGYRCFGLDFSHDAAKVGWSVNGVPVLVGDFMRAPYREGTFAAVTMFHVLEHLYDPGAAVRAVGRLLRPDGRLIVQVPNASCWQFLLFGEKWNGIDVPRHLVNFRQSDIEALLDFCGFEVIRRKHFSLRDNPAGLASSLAPGLDPMSRRVRKVVESEGVRLLRDLMYLGLTVAAIPFTLIEAVCGAGSTIMLEARKKPA
ncbi:MAG: class I SAM-dependent methyltransferase [Bryobacteraceae bacterium]|nr:class I SAM-dependent methyltransferase [Bryobacteraceae bacterium]